MTQAGILRGIRILAFSILYNFFKFAIISPNVQMPGRCGRQIENEGFRRNDS